MFIVVCIKLAYVAKYFMFNKRIRTQADFGGDLQPHGSGTKDFETLAVDQIAKLELQNCHI